MVAAPQHKMGRAGRRYTEIARMAHSGVANLRKVGKNLLDCVCACSMHAYEKGLWTTLWQSK